MIKEIRQFASSEIENSIDTPLAISVFLAGGITRCFINWQSIVINKLKELDKESDIENNATLIVYNPSQDDINVLDEEHLINERIKWDCERLEKSNILSFYFAGRYRCTSSQLELGLYGLSNKDMYDYLIIGTEKDYIGSQKLNAYLKLLLEDKYNNIVHNKITPEEYAVEIYKKYESIIKSQQLTISAFEFIRDKLCLI